MRVIRERAKSHLPMVLLTLLSIVQAFVFDCCYHGRLERNYRAY